MNYTKSATKYFMLIFLLTFSIINNCFAMKNLQSNLRKKPGFRLLDKVNLVRRVYKAISPSGRYIVPWWPCNRKVVVYDLEENQQICSYQHEQKVLCVAFSPSGTHIASGSYDGEIIVYDIKEKQQICSCQHLDKVNCIAFSFSGKYIVSGIEDEEVIVYDIKKKQKICSYQQEGSVWRIAFGTSDRYIAFTSSGLRGKKVIVYDIKKKQQICSYKYSDSFIGCVTFSPSDRHIAFVTDNKKVVVYDIEKKQKICSYQHDGYVSCISFSPSGKYVASGSKDDKVVVYDIEKRRQVCSYKHGDEYDIYSEVGRVVFNPSGKLVASGSTGFRGKKVVVYDVENQERVCSYSHNNWVMCIVFSFSGKYIASGSKDKRVIVYDIGKKQQICSYQHDTQINCVAFSPSDKQFMSVDWGGQVQVWRKPEDSQTKEQKVFTQKRKPILQRIKKFWPMQKKVQTKEAGKKNIQNLEHSLRGVIVNLVDPNPHAGLKKPSFLVQFDTEKKLTVCNAIPRVMSKLKKNMNVVINPKTMTIIGHVKQK